MEPKSLVLTVALALLVVAAADDQIQTLDGCQSACGGVPIPFPFGVGNSSTTRQTCFLEEALELTCVNNTLYWADVFQVTAINIAQGKVETMFFVSEVCYNSSDGNSSTSGNLPRLRLNAPRFTISSDDNKFVSVGCDTYGYLNSFYDGAEYETGCLTRCYNNDTEIDDGKCSGIGCCQVDIPPRMRNITLRTFSYQNFKRSLEFNKCSYSFVVKNGNYTFSKDHLLKLPHETMPVVFDWAVGTCEACKGNATCVGSNTTGYGYQCLCNKGYEGNPYHPDGCLDIDECEAGIHGCESKDNCRNLIGPRLYECYCPEGQSGNGTKEQPCHKENILPKYVIGIIFASLGSIILLLGSWWLYKVLRKRKIKKRKEKYFKRNGGLLLQQKFSSGEVSIEKAKHFSLKDLEKATDRFNVNRVLGKGGQGTVYKGMLVDGQIIAVKKFSVHGKVEEFINEFVILSQISHRNVVKLLGCCLETEIPLLVYEFIPNGNLFEYLHEQNEDLPMTWEMRLRIATEVAGALFYLHSAANQPIYHRDIKSTNILLDGKYRTKVADFGASRMISIEDTHLTTIVQGTFGYLDPEYFYTSQFTEKSDVYSYGVVLIELLTGQKPISSLISEVAKSLASHFIIFMEENRLLDIIDERVKKEGEKEHIIAVANIAYRCLALNGMKRPTMREVASELDGIWKLEKKSNAQQNLEEIKPHAIEDYQPWDIYAASDAGPTPSNRIPTSEVMPFLRE